MKHGGPVVRPTIRDVATAARVSTATVSRVVNGNSRVDPELRDRVLAAVQRLGYRPSATARRLVAGRTGLVGVLVPDLGNPFFHSVLKGLTTAATVDGYGIVVADAEESPEREVSLSRGLLEQTDALVLCSPRMEDEHLQELAADSRPTVCVNHAPGGVSMPCINMDDYEGALCLAGHLTGLGHRRIAYLRGPKRSWSDGERWRALQDAAAFGLMATAIHCGSDMDSGYAAAEKLGDLDVTAVVAFNDYVAFGLLAGLQARGVRVPEDMSLAGFDDIPFATYVSPAITTVRRPVVQLGGDVWHALTAMISGVAAQKSTALRSQIVVRASTAAPRTPPETAC